MNWGAGGEPTEVVLRFAAGRAAERVRETNWHESQTIEDMPDGGCVLRIVVGSTQEMKPWIRQWGPDCEVLAPAALRDGDRGGDAPGGAGVWILDFGFWIGDFGFGRFTPARGGIGIVSPGCDMMRIGGGNFIMDGEAVMGGRGYYVMQMLVMVYAHDA